jgi:hypothetical protein
MGWHLRRNTKQEVRYTLDLCTQTIGTFDLEFAGESGEFPQTESQPPLPASHLSSPLQAISILPQERTKGKEILA